MGNENNYWEDVYKQAEPKPLKFLHADGTINENSGAGGSYDDTELRNRITQAESDINNLETEVSNKGNEFFFKVFITEEDTYLFSNDVLSEKLGVDFPNLPDGTIFLARYYNNATLSTGSAFNDGNSFIKVNGAWQYIEGYNSECDLGSSGLWLENGSSSNSRTLIGYVKLFHNYVTN